MPAKKLPAQQTTKKHAPANPFSKKVANPRTEKSVVRDNPFFFSGFDPATGQVTDFLPRYPFVFSEAAVKSAWRPDFDCFYQLYFEENKILKPNDAFLYRHLLSLANRGTAISVKNYAAHFNFKHHTVFNMIDRLQDAFLLYRVCRMESQGQPMDLILITIKDRKQWENNVENVPEGALRVGVQTVGDLIRWRVETGITRIERRNLGREYPPKQFRFYQSKITEAFDREETLQGEDEKFTLTVIQICFHLFRNNYHNKSSKEAKKAFIDSVIKSGEKNGWMIKEKHILAALEIKNRYAGRLF